MPDSLSQPGSLLKQLEEKIASAQKVQQGLRKMVMSETVEVVPPARDRLEKEVDSQLLLLRTAQERIQQGLSWDPPSHPTNLFDHYIPTSVVDFARICFRVNQLRDLIRNESRLGEALATLSPCDVGVEKDDRWKSSEHNWQLYLSHRKRELALKALKKYQIVYPLEMFPHAGFPSRPVSGKLRVRVHGVDLEDGGTESLIVQIWVDGTALPPLKLKRLEACELKTHGVTVDCNQAQTLEIQIFDKRGKLLAFTSFRLSWLEDHLPQTFKSNEYEGPVEMVPWGRLEVALGIVGRVREMVRTGMERRGAIKRQPKTRMGHDLLPYGHAGSLFKCAHCQEMIYSTGLQCQRCRYACHKGCANELYVRCLAAPQYQEWETMTKELSQGLHSHGHAFKEKTASRPNFCAHCGHLIPLGAPPSENFKCRDCGIYVHEECETFIPDFCGLRRADALKIASTFRESSSASSTCNGHGLLGVGEPEEPRWPQFSVEQFENLAVIGKGNFGKVMLARIRASGQLVALKVLKKSVVVENDEGDSIRAERRVFALVASEGFPFLVNCFGVFQTQTHLFFVMEFVPGGDLMFHIQKIRRFNYEQVRFLAAEVLLALEYLHRRHIIYRDLKLDNILLALDGHIKLADYGLCRPRMTPGTTTSTFCGTPEFIAPEIVAERPYDGRVDWWSFGVLIYELLFSRPPFTGPTDQHIFNAIKAGRFSFPPTAPSAAKSLIKKLLVVDPKQRLGARGGSAEIKKHLFFEGIDFVRLAQRRIEAPYKPAVRFPADVGNFDPEFTGQTPHLTPCPSYKHHSQEYEQLFSSVTRGLQQL